MDTLEIFGLEYQNVTGFKATDDNGNTLTYIRPSGTKQISANGTGIDVEGYAAVDVAVPTGTARSSSDLMASNLTVTAPAGLYAEAASKTLSDANLVAGNIKKDISIFGVTGTYEGSGGSVLSGTFTPASDVGTVTISALAGTTLKRFLLKITGGINSGKNQSKRAFLFCYIDFDKDCSVQIATNSSGNSSAYSGGYAPVSNAVYSLNRTTGVFTVSTSVNNGGLLMSGFTYDWMAW